MFNKKKICVFCGSSLPIKLPEIKSEIEIITDIVILKKFGLIYGGAKIGVMGIIANSMMEKGGEVIGIIPKILSTKEIINNNLSQIIVVESMHERKKKMYDFADVFLVLPGGVGTLEEFAEVLTWRGLGIINKKIIVLNTKGYYNNLFNQFKIMFDSKFLYSDILKDIIILNSAKDLIRHL